MRRLPFLVFGRVSWEPPPFLTRISSGLTRVRERVGSFRRQHRGAFAAIVVAVGVLLVSVPVGWLWYASLPQPLTLSVDVVAPGPTPLEKDAKIQPLLVRFGGSAARLEDVGQAIEGLALRPPLEGAWTWTDDRVLRFEPTRDWGVGQSYELRLPRELFPAHVLLARYSVEFESAPFVAELPRLEFYQDPEDPKKKTVVGTLRFSHPVDPGELEGRVKMELTGDPDDLPTGKPQTFAVEISYDEFGGEAYVHSEPLPIPPGDATMVLTIAEGVRSNRGGPRFERALSASTTVPGMLNYFRIQPPRLQFVNNERGEPETVLAIETTVGVLETELQRRLRAWILPVDRPAEPGVPAQARFGWGDPSQVSSTVLDAATPLELVPIPTEREFATLHAFEYRAEPAAQMYLRIEAGVPGYGGYELARAFATIQRVPAFRKEIRILHEGGLLSLSGERKLSVLARDAEALRFSVGQVRPGQLNHIVSQSRGSFTSPSFFGGMSGESFSEYTREVRALADVGRGVAQYASYDFGRHLTGDGRGRGLFFFEVSGWDPETQRVTGPKDQRLILLTDLGVVVKRQQSGAADVFVQSLASGEPVGGARVSVVAKNGIAIFTAQTDGEGRASVPSLEDANDERTPVAYLVERGDDLAFLPFSRRDRAVDFSRFDIGGLTTGRPDELRGYLFSERGIYRPGDPIHVGMIVRTSDFSQDTSGTPIEVVVRDPRSQIVERHRMTLPPHGFAEITQPTFATSATGPYTFTAHLIENGVLRSSFGSTSVRVEEFLPDRMRIQARLEPQAGEGWLDPSDVSAVVELQNLFGTPAADRRVAASLELVPGVPAFRAHEGYQFFDPARTDKRFREALPDGRTDANGQARFAIDLSRFASATYRLNLFAEGFEAAGGRSVAARASVLVSPRSFLVGVRSDSKLDYLDRESDHDVEWIAVDRTGGRVDRGELELARIERKVVSVLTRQRNGTYRYESRPKETTLETKSFAIEAAGTRTALDTTTPGDYALAVRDERGQEVGRVEWSVVGPGNLTRDLEKTADLEVKLAKDDFEPGEEIALEIKAPYAGAGLITLERDRVYAHRWFASETTSSTQTIRVPAELEGNGYVVVTFVRALDSPEIFTSPMSRAAVPVSVSRARHRATPRIDVPELARPGEPLEIRYSLDRPGRMVVFAVDEGILQVAGYETPDPLGFFFAKRALEVETLQILDLLLPEFSLAATPSAPSGDQGAALLGRNLNPFKRRGQKPAVFWSGIVDASPEVKTLRYTPPESFNGSLRILAVAATEGSVGVARRDTRVRGHFVINPNVPTFVAPGDRFTVTASVANQAEGSGAGPEIDVQIFAGSGLEIEGGDRRRVAIDEGREATVRFDLRAARRLGPVDLRFEAALGDRSSRLSTDLSVRPAAPFRTDVKVGILEGGRADIDLSRRLYAEFRTQTAGASVVPLSLASGLVSYLDGYPYGCTEQLVSQAFPYLALRDHPELAAGERRGYEALQSLVGVLRARQNGQGAFGLWADNAYTSSFVSVYAAHFLTEAIERGEPVDPDLLSRALRFLEQLAQEKPRELGELRTQAYAIYVLTRNERVTTRYVTALRERLDERFPDAWKSDLTAAYLAASYALMRQDGEAARAIARVPVVAPVPTDYAYFYDPLARNGQMLAILSRHFPERAREISGEQILALTEPIRLGQHNTFSSAQAILGLSDYAKLRGGSAPTDVSIEERSADGSARPVETRGTLFPIGDLGEEARGVRISSAAAPPVFYQVTQAGFDAELPGAPIVRGLEIQRAYWNAKGDLAASATLGEEIEVHLKIRGIDGTHANVAVVDLLPGGFEVVRTAGVKRDGTEGHRALYTDIREDRVLLFGDVGERVQEIVYTIKATNVGRYVVPPTFAESMYDRRVQAQGVAGSIEVVPVP